MNVSSQKNIIEKGTFFYSDIKKNILDVYEKSKTGNIDLFSIHTDTLEKMFILLEEIKLQEKNRLNAY